MGAQVALGAAGVDLAKKEYDKRVNPQPNTTAGPRQAIQVEGMEVQDPESLEFKLAEMNRLKPMGQMDFNPMRQNAIGNVNAGVDSSYQSTLGNLARSGGLSAADRLGAGSEMAKQKAQGTANVMGKLNELQAQNRFDVNRFNTQNRNNLYLKNLELQNRQREFNVQNQNRASDRQLELDWEKEKLNKALMAGNEAANRI